MGTKVNDGNAPSWDRSFIWGVFYLYLLLSCFLGSNCGSGIYLLLQTALPLLARIRRITGNRCGMFHTVLCYGIIVQELSYPPSFFNAGLGQTWVIWVTSTPVWRLSLAGFGKAYSAQDLAQRRTHEFCYLTFFLRKVGKFSGTYSIPAGDPNIPAKNLFPRELRVEGPKLQANGRSRFSSGTPQYSNYTPISMWICERKVGAEFCYIPVVHLCSTWICERKFQTSRWTSLYSSGTPMYHMKIS